MSRWTRYLANEGRLISEASWQMRDLDRLRSIKYLTQKIPRVKLLICKM